MRTTKPFSTDVSGVSYEVQVQLYEDLNEAVAELGEAGVLRALNAKRKQDSVQGPKGAVRSAIEEHGPDSQQVSDAIREAQESTLNYRFGQGGGGRSGGGPTKKAQNEFGQAVTARILANGGKPLTQAELKELAAEHGIS
jgi:hypothetical protein